MGAEAVVGGLKAHDAAEFAAIRNLQQGLEVAVVAAVLVNGKQAAMLLRKVDKADSFLVGGSERFVDYHIMSCSEALAGDRGVRVVRSSDDNEAYFGDGEKVFEITDYAHVGIGVRSFATSALQDGGEAKAGDSTNDGSMEGAAGKAEADEGDLDHFSGISNAIAKI